MKSKPITIINNATLPKKKNIKPLSASYMKRSHLSRLHIPDRLMRINLRAKGQITGIAQTGNNVRVDSHFLIDGSNP